MATVSVFNQVMEYLCIFEHWIRTIVNEGNLGIVNYKSELHSYIYINHYVIVQYKTGTYTEKSSGRCF